MKVKYQDKELLETIHFISFGPDISSIEIEYKNESLVFEVQIIQNAVEKQAQYIFTPKNKKTAVLTLKGCDNFLHFGPKSPIKIGDIGGRQLYTTFNVHQFGGAPSTEIVISFYIGAEVDNG